MSIIKILTVIIAIEHLYILWLEMFAWDTAGRKIFKKFPSELFQKTKAMAANQGLYNGFLAAGLIWSLFVKDIYWSENIAIFFLSCVSVAGIYGAYTVQWSIFIIQALPAIVVLTIIIV